MEDTDNPEEYISKKYPLYPKEIINTENYENPASLVDPRRRHDTDWLFNMYMYWVSGTVGSGVAITANMWSGRPKFAGIHKIAFTTGACLTATHFFMKWYYKRRDRREWFFYNYVLDHPDQFPVKKRELYRDHFQPWVPQR